MKKLWLATTLASLTVARCARAEQAGPPKSGCTGQEADVEAALSCRLGQDDRAAYGEALLQATNSAASSDEIRNAREKVTEHYLAKLPKDQQEQFSSFVGKSNFKVPEGVTKQLQDAGICPDGAYDKGQCVSKVDVANKPTTSAKAATSSAPAKDAAAKGLTVTEPPKATPGAYPEPAGGKKKPFKLNDTQKQGLVSGIWGALLGSLLMGPAGLILMGGIAATAGYLMAKQGSDDSGGGGKPKSGGGHHDGGAAHDSPGSHVHLDTSKIHF